MPRRFLLLFLALFLVSAKAADPRPGKYVLDQDIGTLDVRRDAQGKLVFDIQSVGSDCHICQVSGVILHGVGSTDDTPPYRCDISFEGNGQTLEVRTITSEACGQHCGVGVSFEGKYRLPPPRCTPASRKTRNEEFLRLYRAHHYAEAAAMLEALASECGEFIGWIEIDQLRNDLALAQYHSGHSAQCVATLGKTIAGDVKDEEGLKRTLRPCDHTNYIEVAKSIWFNKKMCAKALKRKR